MTEDGWTADTEYICIALSSQYVPIIYTEATGMPF